MNCGILLVATGEKYVNEALPLVSSIRHYMPDVKIAVITDESTKIDESIFDIVERPPINLDDVPANHHGFMFRDYALTLTPFDYTLHVDTDTIFGHACYEIFHGLKRFDLLVAGAPARVRGFGEDSNRLPQSDVASIPIVPRINCGFIAYRRRLITSGFFKQWIELYKNGIAGAARKGRTKFSDQSVFRRAIWNSDVNYQLMPPEYNFRTGAPQYLDGFVKIAHGRPPMGREIFIEFVNSFEGRRLYVPYRELICHDEEKIWPSISYTEWLSKSQFSRPAKKVQYANS